MCLLENIQYVTKQDQLKWMSAKGNWITGMDMQPIQSCPTIHDGQKMNFGTDWVKSITLFCLILVQTHRTSHFAFLTIFGTSWLTLLLIYINFVNVSWPVHKIIDLYKVKVFTNYQIYNKINELFKYKIYNDLKMGRVIFLQLSLPDSLSEFTVSLLVAPLKLTNMSKNKPIVQILLILHWKDFIEGKLWHFITQTSANTLSWWIYTTCHIYWPH